MNIAYDHHGRMAYNPEFHENHRKPWSEEDLEYLIEWYDVAGLEEMSFALGRTIKTVATMVYDLRKKGIMPEPQNQVKHKRIKKEMAYSHQRI